MIKRPQFWRANFTKIKINCEQKGAKTALTNTWAQVVTRRFYFFYPVLADFPEVLDIVIQLFFIVIV